MKGPVRRYKRTAAPSQVFPWNMILSNYEVRVVFIIINIFIVGLPVLLTLVAQSSSLEEDTPTP